MAELQVMAKQAWEPPERAPPPATAAAPGDCLSLLYSARPLDLIPGSQVGFLLALASS